MKTLLIIISYIFYLPHFFLRSARAHTHTVVRTHSKFPRLAGRGALLIQRKEGPLGRPPSIIHPPESIDFSV